MSDPLLAISDLSIEREERLLLNEFGFQINTGEIVQIAGPNGVGKTSLMRVMAGFLESGTGSFRWRGQQVDNAVAVSDDILYLGHKAAVRDQLTPLENLRWFAQLQSQQVKPVNDADFIEALAALGLSGYEDEHCSILSAGQKRCVGLARMAISNAPLWILDEPFTAVDVEGVKTLLSWIEDYAGNGGAIFYTAHQKVEFKKRSPRILDLSSAASVPSRSGEL